MFENTQQLPSTVFSASDSDNPEDLWRWMDSVRSDNTRVLAIPHNGNASDGAMFANYDFSGEPITAEYSALRMRNEPLYEIIQIKGSSDTHPDLSPNDEFADFEIWDYYIGDNHDSGPTKRNGSYLRRALLNGLVSERSGNGNPFRYGIVGDSDTHNAAAANEEFNYSGKFALQNLPENRLGGTVKRLSYGSGGLTGVWAEHNTRGSIYAALARRETFATSGPRIKIRIFGGWNYASDDLSAPDPAKVGYRKGVPMGSTLPHAPDQTGSHPSFLVWAMKDPNSGHLDRIQMVKGLVDDSGAVQERVYDIAWSGDRSLNAGHKLPPVGNTVDIANATYENSIGAAQLSTVWTDTDFQPSQPAFYYLRVLEIPTPRWSTYDAAFLGQATPSEVPATIQERAWSSPIWYDPAD